MLADAEHAEDDLAAVVAERERLSGLLGSSEVNLWVSYGVMLTFAITLAAFGLWLLKKGAGVRS